MIESLFIGDVIDIDHCCNTFKKTWDQLFALEPPCSVPKTCIKSLGPLLERGVKLATWYLYANSGAWERIESILAQSLSDIGFAYSRVSN